ncbi:signal peptidase [Georgenia soli]|uniref:Signal peptidase I n=1 Tax=Georgenia soli TaxID=638953 RepID=A0A2A9ELE8_9MICO|nr:signal peptidase I [Georgenia soli]PFG39092.1 signal peptidase [Georgenia soli]
MATTLRRALNPLLWLILGLLAAVALAIIVVPRVLGWVPLTVLTGSMEPTIPTGSQVIVEPLEGDADAEQLQIGDVVTFMPYPDDQTLVTHRIVSRSVSTDGSVSFTTQGDANNAADPWEITATQLRGEVRYHVPYAGYVANALDGNQKSAGIVVVAAILFGYAALQLVSAVRDARRPKQDVGADEAAAERELDRDEAPAFVAADPEEPTADPAELEVDTVDRTEQEVTR